MAETGQGESRGESQDGDKPPAYEELFKVPKSPPVYTTLNHTPNPNLQPGGIYTGISHPVRSSAAQQPVNPAPMVTNPRQTQNRKIICLVVLVSVVIIATLVGLLAWQFSDSYGTGTKDIDSHHGSFPFGSTVSGRSYPNNGLKTTPRVQRQYLNSHIREVDMPNWLELKES